MRLCQQVTRAEYLLLLATFIAIMELELELGVAAGVLMCIIFFTVTYAKVRYQGIDMLFKRAPVCSARCVQLP